MRILFVACSALALAACGASETAATNSATTDVAATSPSDNMMMDNMAMANTGAAAGSVTVTIDGVRANGGPVLVALQNEGQFAKSAGAYTTTVEPTGTSVTATFQGVSPGSYAAAAVQDTNSDGTFTIGDIGPTEPFGFSGTAQAGAPTFAPAAFQVAETGGTASVTLRGGS